MKKILLGAFSAITIAAGALLAQTQPLEPCSPIPAGCTVKTGCDCKTSGSTTVCTDSYECPKVVQIQ